MKKIIYKSLFLGMLFFVITSCNNNKNQDSKDMETENIKVSSLFPVGERGSSDWFTGEVYVQGLVSPDQIEGLYSVGQVTFEPRGKTNWHTHPIGQVLLVTEGKGWYQERGKPAQPLTPGSVVTIPKDVEHWHGAAKDSKMVHIAISNIKDNSPVTWLNPVTDEEYNNL
ncbi:MAG: cupin domain-containing protein [Dysgonomonas sp.]|nr:cupin domain-containing protein [Dysgonomonas sp.]